MKTAFAFLVRLATVGVASLALVAWAMPSNVVRLISKEEYILLGRYGIDHFHAATVLTMVAAVAIYVVFAPVHLKRQRRVAVVAWSLTVVVALTATDVILRVMFDDAAYVHVGELRLRPPNMDHRLVYEDAPLPHRSLPTIRPGYPSYEVRMRTDARGLRNPEALDAADVLLLGDSFTEGSRVGDDETWAGRLAAESGLVVYNLANSGDDPQKYLAKFDLFGRDMGAGTIIVTLYEGNDFRRSAPLKHSVDDYDLGEAIGNYFRFAPIRVRYERLLREGLGRIRADAPVDDRGALDWLPFPFEANGRISWYFVKPKRIELMFTGAPAFAADTGWHTARDAVDALISAAARKGARVIVAYAPTKARVMMPLVVDALDAVAVLRYVQLLGDSLPDGLTDVRDTEQLAAAMARYEGEMERVVRDYFEDRGIMFVSLTGPLREAAKRGLQTYFTYDQHWTPDGHRVVADEMLRVLGRR